METLITERLILREWKETDSKDLYEYAKSELVGPNAGWPPHKNEEESKEIIKMFIRDDNTYAIVLKEENKVIGGIGLHDRKPDDSLTELKQKEIGYVLNPKYWGRGIIPEAVNCLLKYGFKYRFQKNEKLRLLDNKEVTTLYYCMFKSHYIEHNY